MSPPTLDIPEIRQLHLPLTRDQLRPLGPECRMVQFDEALATDDLVRVAEFLRGYPDVTLRVYGYRTYPSLDFLELFGDLRRFHVEIHHLQDWSGLRSLRPDLASLALGATHRKLSLAPLERFGGLRKLWLEGHRKDFEVVGGLTQLRHLSLRSITLPDLRGLAALRDVERFELKLGGTRNLDGIQALERLRYFEAWLVRGLADLSPLGGVPSLEFLFLESLRQVTMLPSFAALPRLRRVHLQTMKGLTDLGPIAEAPALRELLAVDMGHLSPEAFRVFVGHPTLQSVLLGIGSGRKYEAAWSLLQLPVPPPDRGPAFA